MMRKFVMTIEGELSDDEMDAAETLVKLKSVRKAAEAAIAEGEVTATIDLKTVAVRAAPATPRAARGSRTPAVTPASPRPAAAE